MPYVSSRRQETLRKLRPRGPHRFRRGLDSHVPGIDHGPAASVGLAGAILEHSQEAGLVLSSDGQLLQVNQAAASLYGYPMEELLTLNMAQLGAPLAGLEGALSRGEMRSECLLRHRDGSYFPAELHLLPLRANTPDRQLLFLRPLASDDCRASFLRLRQSLDHGLLERRPVDTLLQELCEQLASELGCTLVMIAALTEEGSYAVRYHAGVGGILAARLTGRLDENGAAPSPLERALQSNLPVSGPWDWDGMPASLKTLRDQLGIRSGIFLPLTGERTLGVLGLLSRKGQAVSPEARPLLGDVANQVSLAIQRQRLEQELHLYRVGLEAAAHAVVIADASWMVQWTNPAFTTLTGRHPEEVIGHPLCALWSETASPSYLRTVRETVQSGRLWREEGYRRHADGTVYLEEQTITAVPAPSGSISHYLIIKQNVTDRRKREELFAHLAAHDPLTGLPNRRLLQQRLETAILRSRRGHSSALLIIDLDNFKTINSLAGYAAGDQVLLTSANLLRAQLRDTDFLARYGDDEYAILMEGASEADAVAVTERLLTRLATNRIQWSGHPLVLGAHAGVVMLDGRAGSSDVLAAAEAALNGARQRGRNRFLLADSSLTLKDSLAETNRWAVRILDAIRQRQLRLLFQPIVRLETVAVDHYEALVRMVDTDGSLISPAAFLPAAERSGLMPELDRHVVDQVLECLQSDTSHAIFMNLSGQSLSDERFLEHLEANVRRAGLPPGRLVFEITETVALQNMERVRTFMHEVQAMGCGFALDDFGCGFSTFHYLRALPADYIKIDGSFIHHLDRDPADQAIVQAIATVAHALGKQVVAEHVETRTAMETLLKLGIEFGQGFLWGKPSPLMGPASIG